MKLRTKLVALSLLTLLLPWSGWKLLQELEGFLREAQQGALLASARTMAGGNMYGDPALIQSALPQREKPFFEAFRQETDPRARKRILSMVSQDMQRALTGQWSQQYAATQGKTINKQNNIGNAIKMSQQHIRQLGRRAPDKDWEGNNPAIDWEDIKAVLVQHEGADTHDFNVWDDRTNSLLRKPYVYGAVTGLTSRQMPVRIAAIANNVAESSQAIVMPWTAMNHDLRQSVTMQNQVNYGDWERSQYAKFREKVLDT